ncbi:MAG: YqaJ viral recombinase family protein [Candidatus Accumulibacter sp.]|nr:YqaJ viral recombinase family protein [Accumulibacter sp.]
MNLNRITHDVQQGTGAWLRLREGFDTASEAPAALGVSKYVTRADLMRQKHTGVAPEHSQATLAKFRAGHAAEADARPMTEPIAGGDLFPVTMSVEVAGLRLLASLDGLTLDGETAWETKLWNEELAAAVRAGTLPDHYTAQMDQELLVSGATRCLFTCTDGTPERFVSCWYEADPAKFEALLSGWIQFRADLAAYALPESAEPAPVGKAPESLPALRIEVTGQVTASNLAEFKSTALAAIRSVNRDLKTDADFADATKAVAWCSDVETRLKAAKEHALSQTATIDALFKTIDDISAEARTVRLELDKLVTRRKTEVKEHAVDAARRALDKHVADLNGELAPMRLQPIAVDFAGAIKGLRSIDSMQNALDTALAAGKIAADMAARVIRGNMAHFHAHAAGFEFLFADLHQIANKAADDFNAVMQSRIATHRAAEAEKERKRVEAEQARIAAEAKRMADEAIRQAEAQRLEAERLAAQQAEDARVAALAEQRRQDAAAESARIAAAAAPAAPLVATPEGDRGPNRFYREKPPEPAASRADEPATLKLGTVCERLGFTMTAAFVADTLGIKPARTDGSSRLYRESDFSRICAALQGHIERAHAAAREEVAA